MSESRRDENGVTTLLGTSNVNGELPILCRVVEPCHGLVVEDGTTGIDLSDDIASRDQNYVTVLMAVSRTDGVTPVAVYCNATTGALLIDST